MVPKAAKRDKLSIVFRLPANSARWKNQALQKA
jgi:hypothetical protein